MATTFDLPPALHERVRQIAAAERRSITQTLILAVEEYVQRHQQAEQVDALSKRIAAEDAELLRRLA
ncbi:MAG: Arc family DNA-binding protein [Micromonosporaceae bacterium]|nr:Arc family DNA-binding protein [Micromonosporaceae bacterium]